MFCSTTPMRFVPFATFASSPSRINTGNVSSEPARKRVDEHGGEARDGHGSEQQRMVVHAV
jgi:hypothetical protein